MIMVTLCQCMYSPSIYRIQPEQANNIAIIKVITVMVYVIVSTHVQFVNNT